MENKKFSTLAALKFGFETAIEHIIFFLGMFVSWSVAFLALGTIVALFAAPYVSRVMYSLQDLNLNLSITQSREIAAILVDRAPFLFSGSFFSGFLFVLLLFKILSVFLLLGLIKVALEFYDLHTATFKSLFDQGRYLLRGVVATGLYSLMVIVGLALFVVPGIIWAIQFGFVNQLIVDKNMSILQAFRASSDLTRASRLHIYGLLFILYIINVIASVLFGMLLVLTVPASILAWTYAYRKLQALPAVRGTHR